jgi:hypothetical protein
MGWVGLEPASNAEASKAFGADLTFYRDEPDTDDFSKTANAAAKMVIDKTAVDSNKDWQTAYKNVVTAVGRLYKKNGRRENAVERGEGTSPGAKRP